MRPTMEGRPPDLAITQYCTAEFGTNTDSNVHPSSGLLDGCVSRSSVMLGVAASYPSAGAAGEGRAVALAG